MVISFYGKLFFFVFSFQPLQLFYRRHTALAEDINRFYLTYSHINPDSKAFLKGRVRHVLLQV